LVEAEVANAELTSDQLESYLELAKINGVDALITISNQFSPHPSHHPVTLGASHTKKAKLLHWSWMYILTQATLLLDNKEIEDREQRTVLNELVRFLSHPSAGVKSFDQMPASWSAIANTVQSGGTIVAKSDEAHEVVGAWYQETRDLCLILSRQLGEEVDVKVPRAHVADPVARLKADCQILASDQCIKVTFVVPNTAAAIDVVADFRKRTIFSSMRVSAPGDRKSTKARVNWLVRQLQKSKPENIHVRLLWPGRAPATQYSLAQLRETPEMAEQAGKVASSFEVLFAKNLGARFAQRKNFIVDLEDSLPEFYEQVGQHLKAWQPQAPKMKEERREPVDVSAENLQEHSQEIAEERSSLDQ